MLMELRRIIIVVNITPDIAQASNVKFAEELKLKDYTTKTG